MTNYAKVNKPKLILRANSVLMRKPLAELVADFGYSDGHIRRILKGDPFGQDFIAMALMKLAPATFDDLFIVVLPLQQLPVLHTQVHMDYVDEPLDVADPDDIPLSWEAATGYHWDLKPQQGPELYAGADEHHPDRVVILDNGVPVLAYEEDDTIRTYPSTPLSSKAMAALRWHGIEPGWTGNTLHSRRVK